MGVRKPCVRKGGGVQRCAAGALLSHPPHPSRRARARARAGTRVVGAPWRTKQGQGSWQQYACAPVGDLFPVGDRLSEETAAQVRAPSLPPSARPRSSPSPGNPPTLTHPHARTLTHSPMRAQFFVNPTTCYGFFDVLQVPKVGVRKRCCVCARAWGCVLRGGGRGRCGSPGPASTRALEHRTRVPTPLRRTAAPSHTHTHSPH